jgi:uncharacterized membrane protein YdjX (TVP38/TMEM64 family)
LPIPSSFVGTASGYLLGFWGGTLATWAGLSAGALIGYLLGNRLGRRLTRRFVGDEELQRVDRAREVLGDWVIIVFRAVPVLAEASTVFAGVAEMPLRRFFVLAALSNLGIALTYAGIGAYSVKTESFLVAFAGAIAIPGLAMLLARRKHA